MPTYEYRCSKGHTFEQFQRMSEEPLRECPSCGAPAERLLSSGAGLLFKGSGFYITDYRSDAYRKAAEADTGSKGKSGESSSGGGGESKGAAGGGASKSDTGKTGSGGSAAASSGGE